MVLTIRKITVPVGDAVRAARAARYPLEPTESPQAFAREGWDADGAGEARTGASAIWLGGAGALAALGLEAGREVTVEQLALALQGQHVTSSTQVRRPGLLVRAANGNGNGNGPEDGSDEPSEPTWVVTSLDLTFSAPKSVSVLWSQADAQLRSGIERAMLSAAHTMLAYMTETKPVVRMGADASGRRTFDPACGFAAAAALHVLARRAVGEAAPAPQLHTHGIVVGVERADGGFAAAESAGMFKRQAPLEGGAVARAVLAEHLVELGFAIDGGTGRNGRFFEVLGVPGALVAAMSGRSRDVEREIDRIEADRDVTLQNRGRAVVAMKTRARKDAQVSAASIGRAWDAEAREHGFGPAAVAALRRSPDAAARPLSPRRAAVRAAIQARLGARRSPVSAGAARAIAFECAAGRLGLADAHELLEQQPDLVGDGQMTTAQVREIEQRPLPARGTARAGAGPPPGSRPLLAPIAPSH